MTKQSNYPLQQRYHYNNLIQLISVNFTYIYNAWIHLKLNTIFIIKI